MSIKIFYAWQSDRDRKICHGLIMEAAEAALKRLNSGEQVSIEESPDIPAGDDNDEPVAELDHDTKGSGGYIKVAEEIAEKIRKCDVFLADLTHVGTYDAWPDHDGGKPRPKKNPNGNVLIELGLALASKSPRRIVAVMNTAFGNWKHLPFDLHLHRKPISYHLLDSAKQETVAKAKEDLTVKLLEAFKLIVGEISTTQAAAKAVADAEAAAESRKKVLAKWGKFTGELVAGKFRGIESKKVNQQGDKVFMMGVGMFPLGKRPPVDVDVLEDDYLNDIQAFFRNHIDLQPYSQSLVCNNGIPLHNRPPTAATEFFTDGDVLAGWSFVAGTLGDVPAVEFAKVQAEIFRLIARYTNLLRKLGVKNPLEIRMVLGSVKGLQLIPPDDPDNWGEDYRPLAEDVIQPDPITLPDTVDGQSVSVIGMAMKPIFKGIWRDAGVRIDPCFAHDGSCKVKR